MNLPRHTQFLVAFVLLMTGFAVGYKLAKGNVAEVDKTKTTTDTKTNDTDHKVTVIVQKPDGNTTTTIVEDRHRTTDSDTTQTSVVTIMKKAKINVSVLAATEHFIKPYYGISINKEVLGPITVGVFGLTNGTLGLSIGFNF